MAQERQRVPPRQRVSARGIPTSNAHSPRKPRAGTPSRARTPCPFPFPKRCRGGGSRTEGGSRLEGGSGPEGGQGSRLMVFFGLEGVKKRGNTTSQEPRPSRDPLHFPNGHPSLFFAVKEQFNKKEHEIDHEDCLSLYQPLANAPLL